MKRDPALVELSRDHHHALVQALALRQAAVASDPAAVSGKARDFVGFVVADLDGHFADEEAELLPVADSVAPEESGRVRAEHAEIRDAVGRLRSALDADADCRPLLQELADRLHDHVRYEERALFERLQQRLSPTELAEMGRRLEAHRLKRGVGPGCRLPASR